VDQSDVHIKRYKRLSSVAFTIGIAHAIRAHKAYGIYLATLDNRLQIAHV